MKHLLLILNFLVLGTTFSFAQTLRLPSFFSNNMVLQRNADVNIWGWAQSGQKVIIKPSWSKDSVVAVTTGDATWKTKLPTTEAGGPYSITLLSQNQKIVLENILIGEVWIVSGQSNMQWSAQHKIKEMMDVLPGITNPNIRFLQVSNIASQTPQDNIFDSWQNCNPQSAASFSAIGYFFAEKLLSELKVPVGIINASWGGSSAEYWTPRAVVEKDEELLSNSKLQKLAPRKPYQPGVLWNSMIYPLVGYNIKGALWYQGEDNTVSYWGYDKLMKAMVNSWREDWNSNFPFYFVQIAPYNYKYSIPKAAYLREQQQLTALTLENSGMVVTTDLVDDLKNIHPQQKRAVALRLAALALANDYEKEAVDYQSPIFKECIIQGDKIRVRFHYLTGGLKVNGKDINELFIAGKDKKFYPAKYKIEGNELIVFSSDVKEPVAVRFGFSDTALPNLFTKSGLPVSPFRTDDWDTVL